MNLYQQLEEIFPYLISIRKLENFLSFDIEFSKTWKLPKKYVDEKMVMEQSSSKEESRMFSFATEFTEDKINLLFENLKNIIKYNIEREEKELHIKIELDLKQTISLARCFDYESLKKQASLTDEKLYKN